MYLASVLAGATISFVMLLLWLPNREIRALAWWSGAYAVGTTGATLIVLREQVDPFLSIALGNALVIFAHGMLWCGTRDFDDRSSQLKLVAISVLLWLVACQVPAIFASGAFRIALTSFLVALWSGMAALELWRGRAEVLASRLPTILFCALHSAVFLFAGIYGGLTFEGHDPILEAPAWFQITGIQGYIFTIASGVTLVALIKERAEQVQRAAAITDSLTGMFNRRAFLAESERMLTQSREDERPRAMIVMDLDRFKRINDRYGHAAGDGLLISFAAVARRSIRQTDLLGRIGGEEFAALIEGGAEEASRIAARIVEDFRRCHFELPEGRVATTLSAGIASYDSGESLAAVLARADRALYAAKQNGRDRIEIAVATERQAAGIAS